MQGTIRKARYATGLLALAVAMGLPGAAPATIVMNGTRFVYGKR
jgi:hypothetical protein